MWLPADDRTKTVPPSSAAVVYATDPLWAAFFAYFALNERLGPAGLAGAALIAAAAFGQNLLLRDCGRRHVVALRGRAVARPSLLCAYYAHSSQACSFRRAG